MVCNQCQFLFPGIHTKKHCHRHYLNRSHCYHCLSLTDDCGTRVHHNHHHHHHHNHHHHHHYHCYHHHHRPHHHHDHYRRSLTGECGRHAHLQWCIVLLGQAATVDDDNDDNDDNDDDDDDNDDNDDDNDDGLLAHSHNDKIPPWWEYVSNEHGGILSRHISTID